MTYYTCLSCPPHSTLDHEHYAPRACLFPECPCKKFEPGAEFFKKTAPRKSREEYAKEAAKLGAAERDIEEPQ